MVLRPTRRDGDLIQPTVFIILDLIAVEGAFLFSFWLRFYSGLMPAPLGIPPFMPYLATSVALLVVWIGIFHVLGLYDPVRSTSMEDDLDRIVRGVLLGSMTILSIAFFYRSISYSRLLFMLFAASSVAMLAFGRLVGRRALRRWLSRGAASMRVLFVGDTKMRSRLEETFRGTPGLGLVAVGRLGHDIAAEDAAAGTSPLLGDVDDLESVVDEHSVDLVLLTLPFDQLHQVTLIAERIGERNVDVQFVPDMQRLHASRMRLREIAGIPFISVRQKGLTGMDRIIKRAFDLVVTVPLTVLLLPLLALLTLLVKLTSSGPVLYRQARLGRDNESFDMMKFRTMRVDAESESGPVWTVADDPRRTIIGSFLRRFSLDELPQVFNVLAGHMSLVGPRPEREVFAAQFHEKIPRYLERHRVRSGITGWAQVHGLRGNTPIEVRTLYDLYYVENWSLALDLRILIKTVIHVLRGENAY
ncbi:undecaprenyl-phosphate glucose phosphotransferase [bacterium]|nr:MAG: undecaprenyl-phosphate glucose phosphotransferase [bacterium]RKZ17185.1 MAG: undecaprenyl-phosphate glucose phosphotransferase [bacterium]